ncbi:MAG TPA: hypothetical protein ENJ84_00580, partial [Gammaproteobacteria bacterium]|nr:hypothetical protein [Gammaproteobacteria bacterium]
ELLRDDGAVVYLNGIELVRDNMAAGTFNYLTPASGTVGGSAETQYTRFSLPATALVTGNNTLAVEIHQRSGSSSDISLDLALTGSTTGVSATIVRGPYLQMGSDNAMTLRWRTNIPTNSRVSFGSSAANLNQSVDDAELTRNHEIRLTGLSAQTKYYYAVGSSNETFASGASFFFETSPITGSRDPVRIWVIGDAGTANSNASAVYNAYRTATGAAYTNLWLMLGDNAYNDGTDAQYQRAVFDLYPELLRQTPVWSTLGNHDGHSASSASESGPYYDIFSFPRQAEVGGTASGTEAYYSYDYGNIHFVVLDSYHTVQSASARDTMMQWLEIDLQNTSADWIIAFWHHPPYSKGSHNSDTDSRMTKMRSIALPILENYGVDLVLGGHSHAYERSKFIDGHYGVSSTLTAANEIDAGSGRIEDTGAYHKQSTGLAHAGAVYAVAGSSGQVGGGALNHNAMYLSLRELGSMILEIDGLTLNASFLQSNGTITDHFTITKDSDADGDGVPGSTDNCPDRYNPRQSDDNSDGTGDLCTAYLLPNNRWQQISISADLVTQNTLGDVFADTLPAVTYGTDWVVFRYLTGSNTYQEIALDDHLETGAAYWMIQTTGAEVSLLLPTTVHETATQISSQCASAAGCYAIPIATRSGEIQWQMLGHPLEMPTNLSSIRITTNAGTCADADGCTLDEAATADIFHNTLFSYNGNTYDSLNASATLHRWQGGWGVALPNAEGLAPEMLVPLP